MWRTHTLALFTLLIAGAAACEGGGGGGEPCCAPTPTPSITVTVSGATVNYFSGAVIAAATVESEGLPSEISQVTDANGAFSFTAPEGVAFDLVASGVVNHRATRSEEVTFFSDVSGLDVAMLSNPDVTRQYTNVGEVPTFGLGAVIVELRSPSGGALEGIPLVDVLLVDSSGSPAGIGPYFFGAGGDMVDQGTLSVSTAFSGRARAGFLEVPEGALEVQVTWSSSGNPVQVTIPAAIPGPEGVVLRATY